MKKIQALCIAFVLLGAWSAWPQIGGSGLSGGSVDCGEHGGSGLGVPCSSNWSPDAVYDDAAACWNFNDDTDLGLENCIADESLDLTEVNTPTATGGALGYVSQWTTDQSAADTSGVDIGSSGDVAMAGWFITTTVGSTYRFIGGASDTWNTDLALNVYMYEDDLYVGSYDDGYVTCQVLGKVVADTRYYFVAYWDDSENKVSLFLNDDDTCTSAAGSGTLTAAEKIHFGSLVAQNNYFWEGTIGPIILWDGAIPSSAVQTSLYNSDRGKLIANMTEDELVGVTNGWEMTEDGGPYVDSIGDNDLAATNTPTRAAGLVSTGDAAEGESDMGTYVDFAGSTQTYQLSEGGLLPTTYSFSFWVEDSEAATSYGPVVALKDGVLGEIHYGVYSALGSTYLTMSVYDGDGWDITGGWAGDANTQYGDWVHVVGILDGTAKTIKVYFDTAQRGSTTTYDGTAGDFAADDLFTIGVAEYDNVPDSNWKFSVDNVALWNRVLTGAEIDTLYNSGAGEFYAVDWMQFIQDQVIQYAFLQHYQFGGAYPRLEEK